MGVNNWFHDVRQAAARTGKATRADFAELVPGGCKPYTDMVQGLQNDCASLSEECYKACRKIL